jgi:hypothetical protein
MSAPVAVSAEAVSSCTDAVLISEVRPVAEGIAFRTSAPGTVRILRSDRGRQGSSLLIEVENARIATDVGDRDWESGPVAAISVNERRNRKGCSTRLTIRTRSRGAWRIDTRGDTIVITTPELASAAVAERRRLVAQLTRGLTTSSDPSSVPCETPSRLDSVQPVADGLLMRTTGLAMPRIVTAQRISEQGFAPTFDLTVEIPGARAGSISNSAQWTTGAFRSMRITRYRNTAECGLRVRLQAAQDENWTVAERKGGFAIVPLRAEVREEETLTAAGRPQSAQKGGAALISLQGAVLRSDSGSDSNLYVDGGAVHELGRGMRLVAVGSSSRPSFAAGLENIRVGAVAANVAAGDLYVGFGDTGSGEASSITALTFQGAGVTVHTAAGYSAQSFFGRAAPTVLVRRLDDTIFETRRTRTGILGAQVSWTNPSRTIGYGIGWVRSGRETGDQHNFQQSAGIRVFKHYFARVLVEQSLVEQDGVQKSGHALTIEPRAETEHLSLGGFVRTASRDFRPPAAADFFAMLPRSYSLYGNYRTDRYGVSLTLGQTKTFNLVDEPDVGTLTDTRSVSAAYRVTARASALIEAGETSARSDPGALVAVDNRTRRVGVGVNASAGATSGSIRAYYERLEEHLPSVIEVDYVRVETDFARYTRDNSEFRGLLGFSERIGTPVGNVFSPGLINAGLTYRTGLQSRWGAETAILESATISGGFPTRSSSASVGVRRQGDDSWINGTARLTYQRITVGSNPAREALMLTVSSQHLARWASGQLGLPPFGASLPMTMNRRTGLFPTFLEVVAFEDSNGNLERDRGEQAVPGAGIVVDGRRVTTDETGKAAIAVVPGKHSVRLPQPLELSDYMAGTEKETLVTTPDGARRVVTIPLRPTGSIVGTIKLRPGGAESPVLGGIQIRLAAAGIVRETTTTEEGVFDFGIVPQGKYTISVDLKTLAEGFTMEGPNEVQVEVLRGVTAEPVFVLRRQTTRERLGVPQARRGP